jgi:hypothetical protein
MLFLMGFRLEYGTIYDECILYTCKYDAYQHA